MATATRHLSGDETLFFGEVEVQALYMPFSHSHTLYGFHLPEDDVVFAPDMMFVRTIPPFDFPDFYYPGYVRALDRLIDLNSDHYIPSHGWRGGHADLVDYRNMTVDFEETVKETFFSFGPDAAEEGTTLRKVLQASYPELKAKYGDWHGFEDMFVPKFARHLGGTYLGY